MRVIVSMTTLPSRICRIKPMVDSILAQTRRAENFFIWLPEVCAKEETPYEIPEWLSGLGYPLAVTAAKDYGPATKLIPVLARVTDPDVLIITVDDDVVYEQHLIEELEEATHRYPDAAIGLMGAVGDSFVHSEQIYFGSVREVNELGGYRGIAYRRSLFDESIFEDIELLTKDGLFVTDDQLFAWNLHRRGKKRLVRGTRYPGPEGSLNFRFMGFGGSIYGGDQDDMAAESHERIKKLYDERGWARP